MNKEQPTQPHMIRLEDDVWSAAFTIAKRAGVPVRIIVNLAAREGMAAAAAMLAPVKVEDYEPQS